MNSDFTIFAVDDDDVVRSMLELTLGKQWYVESFASAEACLTRLNQPDCIPDVFLLDVDLPGMDGYTLCRQIKTRTDITKVPVIFISGLDDLESRIEGFDAGGIDFLVKPYNSNELKSKISTASKVSAERLTLNARALESEMLASLVLSNMDECAVLIKFLRSLNDCDKPLAIVDALSVLLRAYGLQCAIQLRLPGLEMTVSENGKNHPNDVAIIKHIRDMDRIFEFKTRAAHNFEHLTILANNVPIHDPERCGRLRDNLSIAAESANARLQAVQTRAESARAKGSVVNLLDVLKRAVLGFEEKYSLARYQGSSLSMEMLNGLTAAFAVLGMSDEQERQILDIVRIKSEDLAEVYDFSNETLEMLNSIASQLNGVLDSTATPSVQDEFRFASAHVDRFIPPTLHSAEVW